MVIPIRRFINSKQILTWTQFYFLISKPLCLPSEVFHPSLWVLKPWRLGRQRRWRPRMFSFSRSSLFLFLGGWILTAWMMAMIPYTLPETNSKRKGSSSKLWFSGAFAVSFRVPGSYFKILCGYMGCDLWLRCLRYSVGELVQWMQ